MITSVAVLAAVSATVFPVPPAHRAVPPVDPYHAISRVTAERHATDALVSHGFELAFTADALAAYDDLFVDTRLPRCYAANRRHRTWRCPFRMVIMAHGKSVYRERGIVRATSGTVRVAVSPGR